MSHWYQWQDDTLILRLRLQPGASRNAILGPYGDSSLRVSVMARAVDGKANRQLQAFLAECFGVPPRQVALLSGPHSRDKRLAIQAPLRLPKEAQLGSAGVDRQGL